MNKREHLLKLQPSSAFIALLKAINCQKQTIADIKVNENGIYVFTGDPTAFFKVYLPAAVFDSFTIDDEIKLKIYLASFIEGLQISNLVTGSFWHIYFESHEDAIEIEAQDSNLNIFTKLKTINGSEILSIVWSNELLCEFTIKASVFKTALKEIDDEVVSIAFAEFGISFNVKNEKGTAKVEFDRQSEALDSFQNHDDAEFR